MADNKIHTKPIVEETMNQANQTKPNYKKIGKTILWCMLAVATVVLFGAAMQKKEQQLCADIKIDITGTEKEMFINENDVIDLINASGNIKERKMAAVDLKVLEAALQKNIWIKQANLFFDNKKILHVNIEEREPIARVFTEDGESFYVDSTGLRLPLSEKLSAKVPVFTGFPTNKTILSNPDSVLLNELTEIGKYIYADSFWMAQVSQINITPQATFELIPLIGNQVIVLGNADNIEDKFNRLYTFYKQAWLQNGINTYSKINVQYNNQIVAVKRGKENIVADSSAAAIQPNIISNNKLNKQDSLQLPTKPIQAVNKIKNNTEQNKQSKVALSNSRKLLKPIKGKSALIESQPKAVLNKRN
ncbi:MAG: hypothetical protein JSR09_03095 [Bacteroidetes bacterium]|nr:hypothetical protein [Bacteroidota bacterium]MBS1648669.1 hypothetical protein [Bacteroidota bacterium]